MRIRTVPMILLALCVVVFAYITTTSTSQGLTYLPTPVPTPTITPEPIILTTTPTLTGPSPAPRPTSTPLTYYRCAVKISNVTTESLAVEVGSNTAISGTYWININYSDSPCKPWERDGARVWIVDEKLSTGEYTVQWLDHFSEPMATGQEACINWMCKPGAGTPCVYVGQDFEMLYDYVYLPLMLGDCNGKVLECSKSYAPYKYDR